MDLSRRLGPRAKVDVKALSAPVRDFFNPRFEALVSQLGRVEAGIQRIEHGVRTPASGFGGVMDLLHELRGLELTRMPPISGTMLSAGCSDRYYFDWITSTYGPVRKHIGLELYLPKPADLPANVEWIVQSVGDMAGVADASVELLFSGQNFEHLFGDDAVSFLLECHRVIGTGGWLVIDSPNRDIARALNWTQPEHTIEFTPDEARELLTLAGFDVARVRGLWLCREPSDDPLDPQAGRLYELWAADGSAPDTREILRRTVLAAERPELSFVWWAEAQCADREPDIASLRRRHAEIFAHAWPERMQRLQHSVGVRDDSDGGPVVRTTLGERGHAQFGPYMPFSPGHYTARLQLRRMGRAPDEEVLATLDACDAAGTTVLSSQDLRADDLPEGVWTTPALEFEVETLVWGGQVRVLATGAARLEVRLQVDLHEEGTTVAPMAPSGSSRSGSTV